MSDHPILAEVQSPVTPRQALLDDWTKKAAMGRMLIAQAMNLPEAFPDLPSGSTVKIFNSPQMPPEAFTPQHAPAAPTKPAKAPSWLPWLLGGAMALGGAGTAWYALRPGVWTRYTFDGQKWIPVEQIPGKSWQEPKEFK